ncbi:reverse transcriptase domain-containing protein [Tanacetum coccineum]
MRTRRSNLANNSNVTIPRRRRRQVSNIVEPEIRTIVEMADNRTMAQLLEAPPWDQFNDLLRACPHHGFSEIHQLDTFYNALNSNDQDSLNSAAGSNFLDKMPRECLRIIESKSKVRNSRNKAVVAKVSSSTPGISPDVVALTTEVTELKNMIKSMLIDKQKAQAPAPVKAVEQSCVTCGGSHSYQHCPATERHVYHDNIQEYVAQAAVANFNQGNNNTRPPMLSNQIRPPGFPPIQNNQNNQNSQNRFNPNQGTNFNQNRGSNFNQNRGNNFNQGQVYQPPTHQTPIYQAHPYQVPTPQIQGVSKTDFESYVKANDAVLKNVQNQGQSLQNQMTNLTDLFTNFIKTNTASTSRSGTLPSQTVTNPREHVNAITTRSVPLLDDEDSIFIEIPKPKAKKTVNVEIQEPNSPKPNSYQPKLPYPERMKVRDKDTPSAQQSRFMKLFKQLRLEIRLKDALIEMPKFNKWLSSLLRNKEKLEEIAITTVNAECSAIILNKVLEKLEDPGKFLIPCALQELDRTNALADSGASINLLPHSIYKQLELGALTPTRMTLELANCSITHPMGITEDVVVRVDGFTFLVDFVVVNFVPDPRVPIILGRPFLRTAKALIDLYEETLTLRIGKEELVYYADKSEKNKDKQFVHVISVIDFSKADPFSGSTTTHSNTPPPSSSPMKTSDNFKKFADELAPLDSLPPGNDDSTLKKDFHEETFRIYSNPLFEFDDNFKSSNVNPLFEEKDKDVEIKSSPSFTITSPEESNLILEKFEERDSIPPGIDLTIPSTFESSSSNPTSPTLTGERDRSWKMSMLFSLIRFVWKMMNRITIRRKIICLLATYLNKKPKPFSPPKVKEIEEKDDKLSSDMQIDTIVMPIRITFDNPIDFNDHFSKPKDFKKDLTVAFDSIKSSILPHPLLDSDSPFTAELSASITLISLGTEDKVFKPGILVYHAIHDKNLVPLEKNLRKNISSGTLLFLKEPSFPLPPLEPPDDCLNFEPNMAMKSVFVKLNKDFYQSEKTLSLNVEDVDSFTFIIWNFLPYFTFPEDSPLFLSFGSEDFVFHPGIVIFHFSYLMPEDQIKGVLQIEGQERQFMEASTCWQSYVSFMTPYWPNPQRECHVGREKAQGRGIFALALLSKEAHKCLIEGLYGHDQKELVTAKGARRTLFTDGSSCTDGSGAGLILTSPEGTEFTYALRFQFTASNNEAEYEALIAGMRIVAQIGVRHIQADIDSNLVSGFDSFSISHVSRSKNKKADALSKIASTSFAYLSKQVLVEILNEKSINEKEVAVVVEEEEPTWMTPIVEYLRDGILPEDSKDASKLRIKARQYELLHEVLYRRSFLKPWLRCVGPLQANYVIRERHEGSCNLHARPRSVVAKTMRSGYYWPTMHRDAWETIRKCKDYQIHRPIPRKLQQPLTPITAPWPFYKWGIDIAGPFPEGPGKVKFLIVAMDYFTKWIEAKAVATISGTQVKKFVWNDIVCRFGLPGEIISHNGKQFNGDPFKDWCVKLNIVQRFASVKHPRSSGLMERENRSLGEGIKARLGENKKNWLEELPMFSGLIAQ